MPVHRPADIARRRGPAWRLKVAVLLASTVFSLVLAELAIRCYVFGLDAFSYSQMASLRSLGRSGLLQPSPHAELHYELRPDLRTRYELTEFDTNSRGLRDAEYSLHKPAGTLRVAVVGDSFTMAAGVPIEDAYHSVLERRLNEASNGLRYEFINFAVGGYYLTQYLATIRWKVLEYEPDVILLGFYPGNDSQPPPAELDRPFRVKRTSNGFFKLHAFSLLGDVWKYGVLPRMRGAVRTAEPDPEAQRREREYVDRMFGEIGALVGEHGIPLVVVFVNNVPSDARQVRELASKHGFAFIDASAGFAGTAIGDVSIYLTDKHPNGKANRIFADAIHAGMKALGLLEPRPDDDRGR
jgi:hypothetical protein